MTTTALEGMYFHAAEEPRNDLYRKYPAGTRMIASRIIMIRFFDTGLMSKQFQAKNFRKTVLFLNIKILSMSCFSFVKHGSLSRAGSVPDGSVVIL